MVQTLNSDLQSWDESPAAPAPGGASSVKVPLVLVLLAVSMFLPEETSFSMGALRMTVVRLLLLLIAPAVLFRFAQMAFHGSYQFVWSDVLVPLTGLWMFVGPAVNDGFDRALVNSGSSALEFCIPYMVARTYLSQRGQAVALVRILCITIAIVGILAIFDEVSRRFLLRETVSALTGYSKPPIDYNDLMRGVLFRATSTLEHPILLGTASLLGLMMATTMKRGASRQFALFGCALGLALSVSSAPVNGAVIGFSFLAYEKITRNFPFRWYPVIIIPVTFLMTVFIVHPNPMGFLFNYLVFDPQTAYYRVLQWECVGGDLVMSSPIIGVGISDDWAAYCELSRTIDSLWLGMAKQYGIPGSILIFLSWYAACSLPISISDKSLNLTKQERQLGFVLNIILVLMIIIGFTVFYWGTVYILTVFLMGIRAHLGVLGAAPREPLLDDDMRR